MLLTKYVNASVLARARRSPHWQAGLVPSRAATSSPKKATRPAQPLVGAGGVGQVAHLLPKGDFMELALVSSPTGVCLA